MTAERPRVAKSGRYTISESARLLKVSRTTLYRLIGEGELKVMIRRHTLRKYISGAELLKLWEGDWLTTPGKR